MDREEPLPLDGSLVLRLNGYYGAAQMLLDRPLLGLGPGGYALRVPVYWTPYEARWFAQTGKKNTHAHNDLLESGADGGVLGIAAYLTLMIYAVLAAVRLMQSQEPSRRGLGVVLAAAFAGFAVDGLFGFNLRVPVSSGLYFLLYGVLAGVGASATPARRWPAAGLAAACLLIACAGLAYAATTFVGERAYQFAAGARDYALQEAARGNAPASRSALAQAETALTEAALRLPGDARPWEMRGHIALMLGNAATAAAHFAEGLRRTPHYPPLLVARARALTEVLREGVERPWLYPGADLWQAGNAAELAALRARELCPPLGAAHEALGRLAVLRAQVANDPEKARAYRAMAQSHLMEALVRGGATNTGIRLELAKLAMTEHDPPAALRFLQQAVALDPRSETAWETFEKFAAAQDAWHAYEEALSQAAHALPASDPGKGALLERLAVLPGRASADAARLSAMVAEGMRCAPGRLAFWGLYLALHPESAPGAALRRAVQEFGVEITALPEPVRALIEASAESSPMLSLYAAELLLAAKQFARADAVLSTPGTEWPPRAQEAALLLHAQAMEGLGRVEEALALSTQARATGSLSARRQYARRLAIAGQREAARLEYEALLRQMSPEEPAYEVVGAEYRALLPDPPIF
jgi:tetratricopeptide (TPR) repeat protein